MKKAELLSIQTSAESQDNVKSSLVNKTALEIVEGTPFNIVKTADGWHVVLGKYRMTEEAISNKKLAIDNAKKLTWDRITAAIAVAVETINNNNN